MLYQRIEITGYLEGSIEPLIDKVGEFEVDFKLSGRPHKAWRKVFQTYLESPTAQKEDGIGPRVKLKKRKIRLTTFGKVDVDLIELENAVRQTNDDFEERYQAALEPHGPIAVSLQKKFSKDEAAKSAEA